MANTNSILTVIADVGNAGGSDAQSLQKQARGGYIYASFMQTSFKSP